MAKVEQKKKENPKLEQRVMADGRISLYLEYYRGREAIPILDENGEQVYYESGKMAGKPKYKVIHRREKERLELYLVNKPKTPEERSLNNETLRLAELIRAEREQQFLKDKHGYRLERKSEPDLLIFFDEYCHNYGKKDIRVIEESVRWFKDFLFSDRRYSQYSSGLKPSQLSPDIVRAFTEYLMKRSKGDGAKTVFNRFKKIVKYAVDKNLIKRNPCEGIVIKADPNAIRKDILSEDEILNLLNTHYAQENKEIRRAFSFCLYTGVRFCDVKALNYSDVDSANGVLTFEQDKTHGHSLNSTVVIPLSDWLMSIIGEKRKDAKDDLIFHLPSHTMCLKALRHWTKEAGIDKHITWHCARHSFAMNVLREGNDIKTVSSLLGHSSIQMTEKYTRALDDLKLKAVNSLPTPNK